MHYLKDKKIVLYRAEHVKDSAGFAKVLYKPLHPGQLWAYVRQLSAKEFMAARAVQQSEEMLFVINWRRDVDAQCFIEHGGVFYNVTRVDTFEGYKEDLRVYAARAATQPKAGDVAGGEG